jgi:hypothetical protein
MQVLRTPDKYFENLAYNDLVKNGDLPNGSL